MRSDNGCPCRHASPLSNIISNISTSCSLCQELVIPKAFSQEMPGNSVISTKSYRNLNQKVDLGNAGKFALWDILIMLIQATLMSA